VPRISGKTKERITFSCDPLPYKKIQQSIENGDFSTITDLINSALIFYFENRKIDFDPKEEIKHFLQSPEGEELAVKLLEKMSKKTGR
jgi:hypothetical protein